MLLVFVLAMVVANNGAWEACYGGPKHATFPASWDRHDPTTARTVPTNGRRFNHSLISQMGETH